MIVSGASDKHFTSFAWAFRPSRLWDFAFWLAVVELPEAPALLLLWILSEPNPFMRSVYFTTGSAATCAHMWPTHRHTHICKITWPVARMANVAIKSCHNSKLLFALTPRRWTSFKAMRFNYRKLARETQTQSWRRVALCLCVERFWPLLSHWWSSKMSQVDNLCNICPHKRWWTCCMCWCIKYSHSSFGNVLHRLFEGKGGG